MAKKKIKRENVMIAMSFLMTAATIAVSIYLISLLARNINHYLSAGENPTSEWLIKFDFDAYESLDL
ncbi:MAG: hypothetical protein WC519_00205 [Parcubacteria group bacterium]